MKFCEQCGTQLSDEARFCPACGQETQPQQPQQVPVQQAQPQWTQQPQPIRPQAPAAPQPNKASRGPGRVLFLLLGVAAAGVVIAALLAAGVLRPGSGARHTAAVEGPGYHSAEEAALAYAEALKAGDLDAMLSTFAVESYAEQFDAAAYWEDMRAVQFSLSAGSALLADDDLTLAVNSEARRAQIVQQIYYQYLKRLLAGTEYAGKVIVSFPAAEDMGDLTRLLRQDPGFADMKIGAVLSPEDILDGEHMDTYTEAYQINKDRRIKWYGAQDMRDVCLELTIGGEDYYLFVSAVRYGGKWYNLSGMNTLGAYLGADGMSGGLIPVDEIGD